MGDSAVPGGRQRPADPETGNAPPGPADAVSALAAEFAAYGDLVHDQVAWRLRAAGTAPSANEVADVVRDTFMVSFAAPVRPPGPLQRAWLLALARNECLRVLQVPGRTPWAPAAPFAPGEDLDDPGPVAHGDRHPGGYLPARELRAMVRWGAEGLDRSAREVLELGLRHGLTTEEVGRVTGLPLVVAARALEQLGGEFTRVLGTLLLARSGAGSCARLTELAQRWDGTPGRDPRRRFLRHADGCSTCAREREERIDPVAVLRLARLDRAPRAVERWVLADATDGALATERAALAERAGPYDAEGFPSPLDRPAAPGRGSRLGGPSRPEELRPAVRG